MLEHALRYLRLGWAVIPMHSPAKGGCSCGERCDRPGKHPRVPWEEYQHRRPTEREVIKWWKRWPGANIAVITGSISGVDVLDLDSPQAVNLATRCGIPKTPIAKTKRGYHVYLAHPLDIRVPCIVAIDNIKGMDLRGDGGYAVLPPSVHESGHRYVWVEGRSPEDVPVAPPPEWLLELIEKSSRKTGKKLDLSLVQGGIPEGQRNDQIFRYACRLRAQGLSKEEARVLVLEAASRCKPPLDPDEAIRCLESAWRYESGAVHSKTRLWLPGRVAVPKAWNKKRVVVTANWDKAREAFAVGDAVVVARPDGMLPLRTPEVVREANAVVVEEVDEKKREQIEWNLFPLLAIKSATLQNDRSEPTHGELVAEALKTMGAAEITPKPSEKFAIGESRNTPLPQPGHPGREEEKSPLPEEEKPCMRGLGVLPGPTRIHLTPLELPLPAPEDFPSDAESWGRSHELAKLLQLLRLPESEWVEVPVVSAPFFQSLEEEAAWAVDAVAILAEYNITFKIEDRKLFVRHEGSRYEEIVVRAQLGRASYLRSFISFVLEYFYAIRCPLCSSPAKIIGRAPAPISAKEKEVKATCGQCRLLFFANFPVVFRNRKRS